MKDKYYKVRRKSDGLFAKKNDGYGGIHWSKNGSLWRGGGPFKQALNMSLKEVDFDECEILVFELKQTGTSSKKDLLK
jgi:hypothetical protein